VISRGDYTRNLLTAGTMLAGPWGFVNNNTCRKFNSLHALLTYKPRRFPSFKVRRLATSVFWKHTTQGNAPLQYPTAVTPTRLSGPPRFPLPKTRRTGDLSGAPDRPVTL